MAGRDLKEPKMSRPLLLQSRRDPQQADDRKAATGRRRGAAATAQEEAGACGRATGAADRLCPTDARAERVEARRREDEPAGTDAATGRDGRGRPDPRRWQLAKRPAAPQQADPRRRRPPRRADGGLRNKTGRDGAETMRRQRRQSGDGTTVGRS